MIFHGVLASYIKPNISSLHRSCLNPNTKYEYPADKIYVISMITILTYNLISLVLCLWVLVYLVNEERNAKCRNKHPFTVSFLSLNLTIFQARFITLTLVFLFLINNILLQNGSNEVNNYRNIGTAMQGVIHYVILLLGGVVYIGIGAATNFTNSGQVIIVNNNIHEIYVI